MSNSSQKQSKLTAQQAVERELLTQLKKKTEGVHYLLAVSGGVDSMTMLMTFQKVVPLVGATFSVVHVHHGLSKSSQTFEYRQRAWNFVKSESSKLKKEFISNWDGKEQLQWTADSENECRQVRRDFFKQCRNHGDVLVLAHHAQDLFETRVLRLLRGVGPQGLRAMSIEQGGLFRPFLNSSSLELREYAIKNKIPWIDDPTNSSDLYLRNWLRNQWLPQLEARAPGAVAAWARSLQILVDSMEDLSHLKNCLEEVITENSAQLRLNKQKWLALSTQDQRRVLALYLNQKNIKNYGLAHLNELVKRLDVEQKVLTFRVLKRHWQTNAEHIWFNDEDRA